jgi:hypothetical protein
MKEQNELGDLLDRLKGEVRRPPGPSLPEPEELRNQPGPRPVELIGPASASHPPKPERFQAPTRPEHHRLEHSQAPDGANVIWSENKETMLFGVLASLIAILGGILAGLDYVTLIGSVSFMLFSFMTVLALFGYYLNFRKKNSEEGVLGERVEQLSRRLEALAAKGSASYPQAASGARVRDKELEQKVDELRMLVKSLAKIIEPQAGGKS